MSNPRHSKIGKEKVKEGVKKRRRRGEEEVKEEVKERVKEERSSRAKTMQETVCSLRGFNIETEQYFVALYTVMIPVVGG
jgi:hypothetical protein